MNNEALIRYKFYLCRKFLDKLFDDKLIIKSQMRKLENAVIKRLAGV